MIPKVIHYCWFGEQPLPELAIKCIESWKKFCPEYEIKEWNEKNFDLKSCEYIKEAYNEKMWAFVSDYARFWIVYHEGGVYFDTDVELIKPIDDIIKNGPFFGLERRPNNGENSEILIAPGLGMAAELNNLIYKEILDVYNKIHFVTECGEYNKTTVVSYVTDVFKKNGFREEMCYNNNEPCVVNANGINIYPWDYFCPMSYATGDICITKNTRSIHHYTASWKTKEEIKMKQIEKSVCNIFSPTLGGYILKILVLPLRVKMKFKQFGIKQTIMLIFNKIK